MSKPVIQKRKEGLLQKANKAYQEAADRLNRERNPFPVEALGTHAAGIIESLHRSVKYPKDYTGAAMIAAAAAAIGNSYMLYINDQWQAPPIFYIAGVGDPSINKSSPFYFAFKPLQDRDSNNFEEYERNYDEYERLDKMSTEERKTQGITETPKKPIWQKTIVDDYTPEALIQLLNFNKRGLLLHKDELASLYGNFNRYSTAAEEAFWLNAFNGKLISIDRKGSKAIRIKYPRISIAGTIQPDLLQEMAAGSRGNNGFLFRFLFAYPVGLKKEYKSTETISNGVNDTWAAIINDLQNIPLAYEPGGEPCPVCISLSREAEDIHTVWFNKNTELTNNEILPKIKSIYGKLDIYIYRIALVLQLLYHATGEGSNTCIEGKTMQAAISLIEYFRQTALLVQSYLNNEDSVAKYGPTFQALYAELPDVFQTKDGVAIAAKYNVPDRTFRSMLNKKDLFTKIKYGHYSKAV